MTRLADVVEATAIRSFEVNTPEAELTELRRRITATRFPEKETVTDFSQGVQRKPILARSPPEIDVSCAGSAPI